MANDEKPPRKPKTKEAATPFAKLLIPEGASIGKPEKPKPKEKPE